LPAGPASAAGGTTSALNFVLSLRELSIGDRAAVVQIGELGELECGAGRPGAKGRVTGRV
jgi:hypothetical protein